MYENHLLVLSPVSFCLPPFAPAGVLLERGGGFPWHIPPHRPDAFSGGQVCPGADALFAAVTAQRRSPRLTGCLWEASPHE